MFYPIAPEIFTIETDFKAATTARPIRPGLSYYFHADASPTNQIMGSVLKAIVSGSQFTDTRSTQFTAMLGDLAWRKPVMLAERDRIDYNGLNYVGMIGHRLPEPVLWGHNAYLKNGDRMVLSLAVTLVSVVQHLLRRIADMYRMGRHLYGRASLLHEMQAVVTHLFDDVLNYSFLPLKTSHAALRDLHLEVRTDFDFLYTMNVPQGLISITPIDMTDRCVIILTGAYALVPELVNSMYRHPLLSGYVEDHIQLVIEP
jgi:hypothetical protein